MIKQMKKFLYCIIVHSSIQYIRKLYDPIQYIDNFYTVFFKIIYYILVCTYIQHRYFTVS